MVPVETHLGKKWSQIFGLTQWTDMRRCVAPMGQRGVLQCQRKFQYVIRERRV